MKRHLLARVVAGHLEPEEPVDLPDGTVVELTLEVPEPPKSRPKVSFRPRKLGVRQPLTRESIYEDVGGLTIGLRHERTRVRGGRIGRASPA